MRWPYRKVLSLKKLSDSLAARLDHAFARQDYDLCGRLQTEMSEVESFTELLLEAGQMVWPEHVLKIKRSVYKEANRTKRASFVAEDNVFEPFLLTMGDVFASL